MKTSRQRLIFAAVIFHVIVSVLVLVAGRFGLTGGLFDAYGVGAFASDGVVYRKATIYLAEVLKSQGLSAWLAVPLPFHVQIYSLLYIALGWCFGSTILSIEPLNLVCYVATVVLVYWLGREAFDERAGVLAAAIVAVWPSLLLHTTQFLKDPIIIAATLAVVAVITAWLKKEFTLRTALLVWVGAELLVVILWLQRREMWLTALAGVVIGIVLLVFRQLKEKKLYAGNTACALLLLLTTLITPFAAPAYRTPPELKKPQQIQPPKPLSPTSAMPKLTGFLTALKSESAGTGSAVDSDVEFRSVSEVLLYMPRAAEIGFLAPFPSMWFSEGNSVGRAGRLLSAFEMVLTYFFIPLAVYGVWSERRRLGVHLLWALVVVGVTALGLAMANVGTLYRMRYPFWIMLVILAAGGALRTAERLLGAARVASWFSWTAR